jgi:RNA polymerase sigma factor (sigma-70 family)
MITSHLLNEPKNRQAENELLAISDEEVERLLAGAVANSFEAKDQLLTWAYLTAHQYFHRNLPRERALSKEDAEDLTSAFFLEFERALPRLQSATRYTRHVLKRNLRRHLRREKLRRLRAIIMSGEALEKKAGNLAAAETEHAWQKWTNEQFLQYQAVLRALRSADDMTRQIIQFRMQEPPLEHKEIAGRLGASETAIRMRVTRFYALVRKKYEKIRYIV